MTIARALLGLEGSRIVAAGLIAILGALLWRLGLRRFRGTTLTAPWHWELAACAAIAGCEVLLPWFMQPTIPLANHWRFIAACSAFCPTMAVLGAKRPQDRAWQWVVASLWLVAAWPALEAVALRPDRLLALHWARQAFFCILIGLEAINALGTRRAAARVTWISAEVMLLGGHLPLMSGLSLFTGQDAFLTTLRTFTALSLMLVSMALFGFAPSRREEASHPWTAAWLWFRDDFGTIWSLRVIERFNTAARLCHWNVRLRWNGFAADAELGDPLDRSPAAQQAMWQLLRRFVSPAWLEERGVKVP